MIIYTYSKTVHVRSRADLHNLSPPLAVGMTPSLIYISTHSTYCYVGSSPKVISQPQSVYDAVPRSTVSLLVMLDPKQTYSTTMQFEWQYCSTRACSNSTEKNEIWAKVESGGVCAYIH